MYLLEEFEQLVSLTAIEVIQTCLIISFKTKFNLSWYCSFNTLEEEKEEIFRVNLFPVKQNTGQELVLKQVST